MSRVNILACDTCGAAKAVPAVDRVVVRTLSGTRLAVDVCEQHREAIREALAQCCGPGTTNGQRATTVRAPATSPFEPRTGTATAKALAVLRGTKEPMTWKEVARRVQGAKSMAVKGGLQQLKVRGLATTTVTQEGKTRRARYSAVPATARPAAPRQGELDRNTRRNWFSRGGGLAKTLAAIVKLGPRVGRRRLAQAVYGTAERGRAAHMHASKLQRLKLITKEVVRGQVAVKRYGSSRQSPKAAVYTATAAGRAAVRAGWDGRGRP